MIYARHIVFGGDRGVYVKVRDLTERVYARVRSAAGYDGNAFAGQRKYRFFDALLHGVAVGLTLPAVVSRADIIERDFNSSHGSPHIIQYIALRSIIHGKKLYLSHSIAKKNTARNSTANKSRR